jgi:ribosomal protein S18 acetylase RimI-like enzyme
MRVKLQIATANDVSDLLTLRIAVNQDLTSKYGKGPWSSGLTEKGVLFDMRRANVYVVRNRQRMVATLALSTRKPWAIDKRYFEASERPLYLTAMAVSPDEQGQGFGRRCIDEACRIARNWPSDAIRLDAYDADVGAGDFYRKCGFREVGRATYRQAPLIYFEMLL